MVNKNIDEFLKLVNAKFTGHTPNGLDDPRRLTVGLSQWTGLWNRPKWSQPEHPWIKWVDNDFSSWLRFSRDIAYSIVERTLSKPP